MITTGADIHIHCEYRKDGVWHNCDNFEWNYETGRYEFAPIYWFRNYDLFGVLAGVRSADVIPIDSPRGLPEDMSLKTKEMANVDKDWTHSHSYLTLRELLKWRDRRKREWKKLKKKYGVTHEMNSYGGDYIRDDNGYITFKYEKSLLNYLIRKLKDKMDDHVFCFSKDDYYDKGDDFRIVFWFDS